MRYEEPLFRPPAEAESLIFQVAFGCPHNRCRFCGMYKTVKYRLRPETEVLAEIAGAGREYPETTRVFLADGDVNISGSAPGGIPASLPGQCVRERKFHLREKRIAAGDAPET